MKVLITGGNTRVMIDKVRYISNIFKGKTSCNIANFFSKQPNYDVTVLGNPYIGSCLDDNISFKFYYTYDELFSLMEDEVKYGNYDIIIHSAAVSDYKVSNIISNNKSINIGKIPSSFDKLNLELIPTKKIIDNIKPWGFKGKLVKFKSQVDMSDDELIEIAEKSRISSNADFIVANCLEWPSNKAYVIGQDKKINKTTREELPQKLLDLLK